MTPGAHRSVAEVCSTIDALLTSRPPLLGAGRLVCVDGRSGSGKSTLVNTLVPRLAETGREVVVVHLDDFYAGWDGLGDTPDRVTSDLLEPLSRGETARLVPWDWHASRWSDSPVVLDPLAADELLLLEGVGAGSQVLTAYASVLVWCEAPTPERRRRALARDDDFGTGGEASARWERWAAREEQQLARERTPERADLVWHSSS